MRRQTIRDAVEKREIAKGSCENCCLAPRVSDDRVQDYKRQRANNGLEDSNKRAAKFPMASGCVHRTNGQHQRCEPAANGFGIVSELNGWLASAACCGSASLSKRHLAQAPLAAATESCAAGASGNYGPVLLILVSFVTKKAWPVKNSRSLCASRPKTSRTSSISLLGPAARC
jgi:hypothetical protein